MLLKTTQQFLKELHRIGAIKIDTKEGFRLTLHDKNPHAPLSPIYINLRTVRNPKPGPLGKEHVESIANDINSAVQKAHMSFDCITGIPRAGTPFAESFLSLREKLGNPTKLIRMKKRPQGSRALRVDGSYVIRTKDEYRPRVLLIDDLITSATTKWTAIDAVRRAGYEVAGIAVYLDREQGGLSKLKASGIPIVAALKFSDMLRYYGESNII
ncbi:MAG: phosphoribosyltransferase family protein [Minisyncoccia bacterium]